MSSPLEPAEFPLDPVSPEVEDAIKTAEIGARLFTRYSGEEWAFLPELRSVTGYLAGAPRYADALLLTFGLPAGWKF